jgi:hypothetical protein
MFSFLGLSSCDSALRLQNTLKEAFKSLNLAWPICYNQMRIQNNSYKNGKMIGYHE